MSKKNIIKAVISGVGIVLCSIAIFSIISNKPMPIAEAATITTSQERYGVSPSHKPFNINAKANIPLSYKSSNSSVAMVSSTGIVTPKKVGKAYVTITAKDSGNNVSTKKVLIDVQNYKNACGSIVSASSNIDGKPGDSNGREVRRCGYIYNPKVACYDWNFIIRCTDPAIADKAAVAVNYIAANNNFGYNAHKPTSQKEVDKRKSTYNAVHKAVGDNPSYSGLKKIKYIRTKADTSCSPTLLAGYWLHYDMSSKIKMNWREPYQDKYYYYNCGTVNIEQNGLRKAIKQINKEYTKKGKLAPFEIIEVSKSQRNAYFGRGKNMKTHLKRGDIIGALRNPKKNGHSIMVM